MYAQSACGKGTDGNVRGEKRPSAFQVGAFLSVAGVIGRLGAWTLILFVPRRAHTWTMYEPRVQRLRRSTRVVPESST